MTLEQDTSPQIALNITRTRVTVLVFNLTIISVMLSFLAARGAVGDHAVTMHLTSFVALFVGFCLTVMGIFWLLSSQTLDAQGLSHPRTFTLGTITMYLALSQTVTAVMHEYLVGLESVVQTSLPVVSGNTQSLSQFGALGETSLLILLVMGSAIWVLTTYVAPLKAGIKGSAHGGWRWVLTGYYFALQVPIYWVYARAWHLNYASTGQSTDMPSLFFLQFFQPLLWFR